MAVCFGCFGESRRVSILAILVSNGVYGFCTQFLSWVCLLEEAILPIKSIWTLALTMPGLVLTKGFDYKLVWNRVFISGIWHVFLKRPENFSGPKTFRDSFRVNFSGPGKRFSTRPKTPRILTRVFWVVFSGLQRELKNLNWHGCTELGSSRTLQIKPSFVESQANFWLFLSFVQFQHRLLYFDWSLLRM